MASLRGVRRVPKCSAVRGRYSVSAAEEKSGSDRRLAVTPNSGYQYDIDGWRLLARYAHQKNSFVVNWSPILFTELQLDRASTTSLTNNLVTWTF